jgi:hypothetical protein
VPVVPHDPPGAAVRVSRYIKKFDWETDEGSVRVPADHVRISVWIDDAVQAAVSLPEGDAQDLARFILQIDEQSHPAAAVGRHDGSQPLKRAGARTDGT